MKQVRPNGLMEDSPLSSPVISPNHKTESGVALGGEEEEEEEERSPHQRHGVKRSLEDGEGTYIEVRDRDRQKCRKGGREERGGVEI